MADGVVTDQLVAQLLAAVPAPTVSPRQDAAPRSPEPLQPQQPGAW
jgi:MoxR-like ATPase